MTELWVEAATRGDTTVLTVRGKILFDTQQPLDTAVKAALAGPGPRIVVDLHEVTMCDSSGLQLLIDARRQAVPAGGWIRLSRPQPLVARVLEITNLSTLLPGFDSVDEAVSASGPPGSDPASGIRRRTGEL